MARYKYYSYVQGKFIFVHFAKLIQSDTFEYSLNHIMSPNFQIFVTRPPVGCQETGFGRPQHMEKDGSSERLQRPHDLCRQGPREYALTIIQKLSFYELYLGRHDADQVLDSIER